MEAVNRTIGHGVAWLTLAMVLIQFLIVVLRYTFGIGMIALQESVVWMHAVVFMLAAAYTLGADGHVRVDVFYRDARPRVRAGIDLMGVLLFLWPVCALLLWAGWPFVQFSWRIGEASPHGGGLPALYLLKSMLIVMPVLLIVQGLALAVRSALVMVHGSTGHDEAR